MATVREALDVAVELHGQGRLDEAAILYARILEVEPRQADALHLLGLLHGQKGQIGQAIALVAQAIGIAPERAVFHINHAKLTAAAGQPPKAAAGLRRALALDPAAVEVWELMETHAPASALRRLVRLGQPHRAADLAAAGRQCLERGDAAAALACLSGAVAAGAADPDTLFALGNARLDAGQAPGAVAALATTLALVPASYAAFYNLGVAAFTAGRPETAQRAFAHAFALRPADLAAAEYRVAVLHAAHRLDEAAEAGAALLDIKDALATAAGHTLPASPTPASPAADRTRRTRRIIAFSLWGDRREYTQGAVENLRLAAEFYPGWTCRLYHDATVPAPVLADLDAAGAERVAMPAGSAAVTGTLWRFLVADDPTVDRFLCRDADSRLNSRERAAVAAWETSPHPFHVLRDHALHTEVMLAGLWGGMAGVLPPLAPLIESYTAGGTAAGGGRLLDQRFLRDVVWPAIRTRCLIHDSVHPRHGVPLPPVPIDPRFAFTHVGASVKSVE